MPALPHLIKFILLITQIPIYIKASNKKKKVFKVIGFRDFKRRSFIVLKKLYRFSCLGQAPIINRNKDFKIGVYQGHKIGLFNYFSIGTGDSAVILISMTNKLPKFLLRPNSFVYYLTSWFTKNKEIHTGVSSFSDKMVLLAKERDKIEVATIFNLVVMRYFSSNCKLWVESDGYNLLIFKENELLFDGEKLDDMLDRAIKIKKILGADRNRLTRD